MKFKIFYIINLRENSIANLALLIFLVFFIVISAFIPEKENCFYQNLAKQSYIKSPASMVNQPLLSGKRNRVLINHEVCHFGHLCSAILSNTNIFLQEVKFQFLEYDEHFPPDPFFQLPLKPPILNYFYG